MCHTWYRLHLTETYMIFTSKTYSSNEAKRIVDAYIEESTQRLKQQLREEWKKQAVQLPKKDGYATRSI